jgi:hypothetical protein
MSKKSSSSLNILDSKIKSKKLLSSIINIEEKKIFLKNNKNALKYYKEFVKMQHNKTRNNKFTLEFLNLNTHEKIEKFKNNPILILKSFDKNLFDEKKRKFKSQTLGVDEGLITLPKNYSPQSPIPNSAKNNFFSNETEKCENNKILSAKNKIKSAAELERGSEIIHVNNNKYLRGYSEKNFFHKNKKFKNDFQDNLNYNFELKKLDNWDFLNEATSQEQNKNLFVLNRRNNRRKSSLINITENNNTNDYKNIGLLLKIKNDKNKMRIISRIKKLEEFFTDFGKEQDVLLLQGKNAKSKNYFLSAFCGENEKKFFEEKKDIRDNTGSINYYKDMIRVRKRTEKNMQEELYKLAEKIHVAKKEKEEAENKGFELAKELKEIYIKETNILKEIKVNKKASDKNHKNVNLNNLYNNESETEKKLIRTLSEEEQNFNNFSPEPKMNKKKSIDEDYFNFSAEKKKFKRNYNLVKRRKNTIIFNNLSKIKKKRKCLLEEIAQNNLDIKEKQYRFKRVKDRFNEKVKFLKEYYYQVLKKGLDVRKDGLSWIIVKLMELNAFIDKNHFPSFLSSSEINYLMELGIKQYELSELIKLFQIFKNHQKHLKEEHIKEDKVKINKIKDEKFNKLLETHRGKNINIGNDYPEYLEEIQRKYENDINVYLNEKAEEDNINKISNKINKFVLTMNDDDVYENFNENKFYKLFVIPGSLSQYFVKDNKFRQYFDDIYYLNEEINKRKSQVKEMKDNEFKKYKNLLKDNFDFEKNGNAAISERSKAFAAIFGNNIPV